METLTPGCLGFRFGKKGPRKPGRLFCWESWGGLGKEPPFLLLDRKSVPGPLSWGRRPQRGCTHGKVAGQELPVLLSKLPHQGPQLLILPKPERQGAQLHACRKQLLLTEPSPKETASRSHSVMK